MRSLRVLRLLGQCLRDVLAQFVALEELLCAEVGLDATGPHMRGDERRRHRPLVFGIHRIDARHARV